MPDELRTSAIERLFRERRLLIGVSIVLLAHQVLGITVGKSAETLGLKFEVDNPERLILAVWLVWLWSFVCYVQQLNSVRPFTYFPRDRQTSAYSRVCDWVVRWSVTRRVKASFYRQVSAAHRISVQMQKQHRAEYNKQNCIANQFQFLWKDVPDDPAAVNLLDELGHVNGWFTIHSGDLKHRDGTRGRSGTVWVPLQMVERRRSLWALAVLWTWSSTSFATDFLIPIVIGLAPPTIAGASYISSEVRAHPWRGFNPIHWPLRQKLHDTFAISVTEAHRMDLTSAVSLAISSGIVGAWIGFRLKASHDARLTGARTQRNLRALRAEIEYCAKLAGTYEESEIKAPLYRFPRYVFDVVYPTLVAETTFSDTDITGLTGFYSQVDQMNRGLDQLEGYRAAEQKELAAREITRLMAKVAEMRHPTDSSPTPERSALYEAAIGVVQRHVK